MKKVIKVILLALVVAFVAAQFVRPDFTNPPVDPRHELRAPANVQAILDRSCIDCHTNRTRYPWYSQITPVSWWLQDHINEGRGELNFSEFGTYEPKKAEHLMEEVCEMVEKGEMPLREYVWGHPSAKLSEADKQALCAWSKAERARIMSL
jgi:hypothetical protein